MMSHLSDVDKTPARAHKDKTLSLSQMVTITSQLNSGAPFYNKVSDRQVAENEQDEDLSGESFYIATLRID